MAGRESVLRRCRDCFANEQSLAKCWPRAEEEVKPCTSICKGVTPRGGGELFSFWLEYNCPVLKSKEIREVEYWKRDVAVLGRAGQGRDAQDCRDLSGHSCGTLGLPQPGVCHGRVEGGSGLVLGNVALKDLGLWFMQAWGSMGCQPV